MHSKRMAHPVVSWLTADVVHMTELGLEQAWLTDRDEYFSGRLHWLSAALAGVRLGCLSLHAYLHLMAEE